MNQLEPQAIDSYLYSEMPEDERARVEEAMLADDDMFFDIAARENELVDLYCADKLPDEARQRFERSLTGNLSRRQKVANAKTLRSFLAAEREGKTITIAERKGFLSGLFSFRSPVLQFVSIGVILLLALASIYLLIENRRLGTLETELADAHRRESELTSQIESERESTGALTSDLDAERERIAKLEAEIAKLRDGSPGPGPTASPPPPTIATLILSPVIVRGGPTPVKRLELKSGITRVSIVVNLPADSPPVERVTVRLNGEVLAERVRVGGKRIVFGIDRSRLKAGRNQVTLSTADGNTIAEYAFSVAEPE